MDEEYIIDRFETVPERWKGEETEVEVEVEGSRAFVTKYNYFPIEWKLPIHRLLPATPPTEISRGDGKGEPKPNTFIKQVTWTRMKPKDA